MKQRNRRRRKRGTDIGLRYVENKSYSSVNMMGTKKRFTILPIILGILLLLSLAGGGYYLYHSLQNQEADAVVVELDAPNLPRLVSIEQGYEVNELIPYTTEMEITTMRDAISPLTPQGNLVLEIQDYSSQEEEEIEEETDEQETEVATTVSYQVYSSDGSKLLQDGEVDVKDNQATLSLSNVVTSVEESLLQLSMTLEDGTKVFYYTRVIAYGSGYLSQNLDFVNQFHTGIYELNTELIGEYAEAAEEGSTSTNTTYQVVTLDSGLEAVLWGELEPTIIGDVQWTITEYTDLFVAVQLEYQVSIMNQDGESGQLVLEYYNVKESYRVGYSSANGVVELKQYQRTMNQILEEDKVTVAEMGLELGIVDMNSITYKANDDESAIGFVQERALYLYQEDDNKLSYIFSLEEIEEDTRYRNTEYDIRILSIDENGSMNFVVYGYMNRGVNEGKVGAAIYYYDGLNRTVTEKAFVTNTQSYAVGQEEMSQGVYYSNEQDIIYIIAQDAFYEVDIVAGTQKVLSEDMNTDNYVISEDGKLIAFAMSEEGSSEKCIVLDLEIGDSYSIEAEGDTQVQPLGFLNHDLIYGYYNPLDELVDETGSTITPMYCIEIRGEDATIQKTYEQENLYIRDISITDNMVTMNMVELEEDEYVYAGQDVITNNDVQETSSVTLGTYTTETLLSQVILKFSVDEDLIGQVNSSQAQLVLNSSVIRISYDNQVEDGMYYAYAYGEIQVISSMASDAIQYASANMGAVVNSDNKYVWRSGNRDLTYTINNYSDIVSRMSNGESAIEIVAESANQNVVSYTGCTTEQMCYIINQNQEIAAKLEDETWIMLVGYTGSTMYYIDANGSRKSVDMSTLDGKVIELIGDGLF